MEMVRTFLANWICSHSSDATDPNWEPVQPTDPIEFSSKRKHYNRLWEYQCLLQETIANMGRANHDIPSSPYLIMLFILAFPGTGTDSHTPQSTDTLSTTESQKTSNKPEVFAEFAFDSPFAPQDVKVRVEEIFPDSGEVIIIMGLFAGKGLCGPIGSMLLWAT